MEEYIELDYQNTCRICLNISENMKDLFALTFPRDDLSPVDFIRKMTDLKLQNCEPFPNNICIRCTNDVFTAYEFSKRCISSDAELRNPETRRILKKIEPEALDEEEISIKLEEPVDNENVLDGLFDDNEDPLEDPLAHFEHIKIESKFNILSEELQFTTDRSKSKYKCEHCPAHFNNKAKFQGHQKTHEEKPFKCSECNQTFCKELHLKVHSRAHIKQGDKKFSCSDCGRQFIYEYMLKQHEFKHKERKPYPCTKCEKGCLTAPSLQRHMKVHEESHMKKNLTCHLCDKTFVYPSFLAEHMKHHTGEKPYLCKICGKGFRQMGGLHFHERVHSGYKPFTCKICKENFVSRSNLKAHYRRHTKEKPFTCDTCGASFRQSKDLKSHRTVHTGEKPVLCSICGKKMNTTSQLTVHLRSHTGEKPFSCRICSKSFAIKTVLLRHERIHSGERPFTCDICGKSFNQKSTLKTHSKTHEQMKKVKTTQGTESKSKSGSEVAPKEKSRGGLKKKIAELQKKTNLHILQNPDLDSRVTDGETVSEGITVSDLVADSDEMVAVNKDTNVVKVCSEMDESGEKTKFTVVLPEPVQSESLSSTSS